MYLSLSLAAALLFALGGLCMKYSVGLTRALPSAGIFICFCSGAIFQTLAMRRTEMGSTYVFVLGLEAMAAFALGALFLGERMTLAKLGALVLVVAGIALLERPA